MNLVKVDADTAQNTLAKTLEAPALDPIVLAIANESLSGKDIISIADEYGITSDIVNSILDKKEVKSYIDNVFLTQGWLNRVKRLNLINDIINAKVQEAIESNIWSKKDIFEWIKLVNSMEEALRPKKNGPTVAVQVNNYDSLMSKLLENKE